MLQAACGLRAYAFMLHTISQRLAFHMHQVAHSEVRDSERVHAVCRTGPCVWGCVGMTRDVPCLCCQFPSRAARSSFIFAGCMENSPLCGYLLY